VGQHKLARWLKVRLASLALLAHAPWGALAKAKLAWLVLVAA
jgi:hypothetical protein